MTKQSHADSRHRSPVFAVPQIIGHAIRPDRPWTSLGASMTPRMVDEANAFLQADCEDGPAVSGAYYEKDGTLVCESRQARNAVLKKRGLVDYDGGYGDYTGGSTTTEATDDG